MPTSPLKVRLTAQERSQLTQLAAKATAAFRDVQRAQILLKLDEGVTISEAARQLGVERPTVRKWAKRFQEKRLAGLEDLPRSGRPAAFPP